MPNAPSAVASHPKGRSEAEERLAKRSGASRLTGDGRWGNELCAHDSPLGEGGETPLAGILLFIVEVEFRLMRGLVFLNCFFMFLEHFGYPGSLGELLGIKGSQKTIPVMPLPAFMDDIPGTVLIDIRGWKILLMRRLPFLVWKFHMKECISGDVRENERQMHAVDPRFKHLVNVLPADDEYVALVMNDRI